MNEERKPVEISIVEMQKDIAYINKHLEKIDESMADLRKLIIQQTELQNEVAHALNEHDQIKRDLSGLGTRITDNTKRIETIEQGLDTIPVKLKVNIFDYVWKYALTGIGGVIAAKVAGFF